MAWTFKKLQTTNKINKYNLEIGTPILLSPNGNLI